MTLGGANYNQSHGRALFSWESQVSQDSGEASPHLHQGEQESKLESGTLKNSEHSAVLSFSCFLIPEDSQQVLIPQQAIES